MKASKKLMLFLILALNPAFLQVVFAQSDSTNYWKRIGGVISPVVATDTVSAVLGDFRELKAAVIDSGGQVFNVKAFGAKGDGVTDDVQAIMAAVNALPSNGGELYFPSTAGGYRIGSKLSLPKTALLNLPKGAILNIDAGDTLIIGGGIKAKNYQVFSGDGTIIFGYGAGSDVWADWWGIVYNDTTIDNMPAIQKAIDSFVDVSWDFSPTLKARGKNIYFSNGTVTVKSTGYLYSGTRLVGQGGGQQYAGTLIDVRDMLNDTVFVFKSTEYTAYYHFGGLEQMWLEPLDGKRPWAAIYILQAGENCVLRDLSIYRMHYGVVYGDGVATRSQVSATMTNVTLHEHDSAAIKIRKSVGNMWFQNISGDGNFVFINNEQGGTTSLSISLDGFKVEGGQQSVPWKDSSTVVRMKDSWGSLIIKDGWIGTDTVTVIFPRFCGHREKPLSWWQKEVRNGKSQETESV
ncbi:MAG: hypothetical protein L0Y80_03865 [Ignavibacteriae bacterium]|nr:hypothetical protein [Ignavibacteriota bacterium]